MRAPPEHDAEDGPARTSSAWSLGVLFLVVAAAAWVRWPLLGLGFSPDEIANVTTASAWQIYDHPETGVNPPALRWLFNLPFDPWGAAVWGRRWSMLWSLAAVVLGFAVGRRAAGGNPWAGLGAALLLALHPWSVHYGAIFRVYAWWSGMILALVWTLSHAMDATDARSRRAWGGAALTVAVMLPWIHYFSVPVLGVMGLVVLLAMPGQRRWFGVFVAAALGTAPLVPKVLFEEGRRVAPDRAPLFDTLLQVGSLDMHPPGWIWHHLGRLVWHLTGAWPPLGPTMWGSVGLALLVTVVMWRRLGAAGRLSLGAALGVFVGVGGLGQLQYVRPATVVLAVACVAPVLFAGPALVRSRALRAVLLGTTLAWFLGGLPQRLAESRPQWSSEEGGPWWVAHGQELEGERAGRPVYVHPKHRIWTVWFHLAHAEPRDAPKGPLCAGIGSCFEHDGIAYIGVDNVGSGATLDGLLLHLDGWRPQDWAASCRPLVDPGTWGLWSCTTTP